MMLAVAVAIMAGWMQPGVALAAKPLSATEIAAQDDALIERLEKSGKLDAALDRAIERRIAREQERREAEAKAEAEARNEAAKNVRPVGEKDRIHGPANAKVSIIVWSDPECPYCKRFAGIPQQTVDRAEGLANSAVRLFPLPFHGQAAMQASLDALCVADQAGEAGYYAFFDGYLNASALNGQGIAPQGKQSSEQLVEELAKKSGVKKVADWQSCRKALATRERLQAEFADGEAAGVQGTPSVILRNNETGAVRLLPGAMPVEYLLQQVKELAGEGAAAK